VSSFDHLARSRTQLNEDQIDHLRNLVGAWSLLCDLCYSDLLLYVPTDLDCSAFVTLGHCRSVTGPTVHQGDPVGTAVDSRSRPLLADALEAGHRIEGTAVAGRTRRTVAGDDVMVEEALIAPGFGSRLLGEYVPVGFGGKHIAVMVRESDPTLMRQAGPLGRTYRAAWQRLSEMVMAGVYPLPSPEGAGEFREPRVGDGMILLDREQRIEFASPNAMSALHRLGVAQNPDHHKLSDLGIDDSLVGRAFASRNGTVDELVVGGSLNVVLRCLPLLSEGRATGALVLVRDISELRSRDRLLLSRDVTIREINHRVKNNLQTIQALLRLQARRAGSVDAKIAIEDSARRVGAIAIVHETLSADTADVVDFDRVAAKVTSMVVEGSVSPDRPVSVDLRGHLGLLPGETAMPLAVVLTELVQNAIEHAAGAAQTQATRECVVTVDIERSADGLRMRVADTGPGFADGFSLDRDAGLGLTIVRTFVVADLGGNISIGARHSAGCVVEVTVPQATKPLPLG